MYGAQSLQISRRLLEHLMMGDDRFVDGASFGRIQHLVELDRQLRGVLAEPPGRVGVLLRAQFAYLVSKNGLDARTTSGTTTTLALRPVSRLRRRSAGTWQSGPRMSMALAGLGHAALNRVT